MVLLRGLCGLGYLSKVSNIASFCLYHVLKFKLNHTIQAVAPYNRNADGTIKFITNSGSHANAIFECLNFPNPAVLDPFCAAQGKKPGDRTTNFAFSYDTL